MESLDRAHALDGVEVHSWSMKPPRRGVDLDEPTLDQMPRPRRARAATNASASAASAAPDDDDDVEGPWLSHPPRPTSRRGISTGSVVFAVTLALTGAALGFTGARTVIVKSAPIHDVMR